MVVQNPWSGFCTPFRANKLSFLPPDGGQPTGLTGASFAHGLTGRVSESLPPTNKTRDTHKGHPGFYVEVAGFEPAAFWSRTKRATKLRYTSKLEPMRGLEPLTC